MFLLSKDIILTNVLLTGFFINTALFLCSIILYEVCSKIFRQKLQRENQPITKFDIILSITTVFINTIVFLIGFLLWKNNIIILKENSGIFEIILETVLIIFVMDLLMYVFHRMMHFGFLYKKIHHKHHHHISTNRLSLFVLHPFESLGFGFLIILPMLVYQFSWISISIYLIINLIWGTIGHLNVVFFFKEKSKSDSLNPLETTEFHNLHHQFPDYNFGFYTMLWDKLLGTLAPFSNEEIKENNGYYFPPNLKLFIKELKENHKKFNVDEFEYYNDTNVWDFDGEQKVTFNGQKAEFSDLNFNNDSFLTLVRIGILECTKEFSYEDKTSKYRFLKYEKK